MNVLVEKIKQPDFPIFFTKNDLAKLSIGGSKLDKLFEESLKNSYIIHIYNDIYTLSKKYRRALISEGVLAQMIVPNSYTSTYYVLSDEAWVPEAVYNVTSITECKNMTIRTKNFGIYDYYNLYNYIQTAGIYDHETSNGIYRRAKPLRALCDYIYMHEKQWTNIEDLDINLRLDIDELEQLKKEDFDELQGTFKVKNVEIFLTGIRKELKL